MLQIDKSPSDQVGEGGSTHDVRSSAQLFATVVGLIRFIRRQFFVVLSVMLLMIGLAAVYLFTTTPLYSGQARMMIDPGKRELFKQSIVGDEPVDSMMVESQIEILKSDNIGLSVIKNLNLTKEPEFVKSSGGLIGTAKNLLLDPSALLHAFAWDEPKSESEITGRVLNVFESRLAVSRVGATYIIAIEFQSADPDRAAQVANAVADAFIVDQLEAKYQTIGRATVWLQDRLNELRAQASAAERAVVEYKAKNNIVDSGGRLINEQELTELNTALIKTRADTMEAQARLDRVSQVLRSDDLDPAAREVATVADTLQNPIITKLRQQYLEIAQREAIFSNRYGSDHLAVVNLRNQMREIRHSIVDELKQIAEAYRSNYAIAKARENSLQESLAVTVNGSQTANKAQIELRQLESAAQTYRALYDNFQQRYTDSVQQQSFPLAVARVITRASRPSVKSSPKSFRILALATVGGLVLGLGLAKLREIMDRVFRTGGQVEAWLDKECMAILPMIKPSAKAASLRSIAGGDSAASRIIAPNASLLRHVIDSPLSRFAESIRAVKVTADLSSLGKSSKVIGITSALPNEGKSTIAAALAQLSAHGARVILVDCDLRKPSLSQDLAASATVGLIDVVSGAASLGQVIWSDPSSQLSFLPVVVKSRLIHTSEILASDAMHRLFDQLRESYDYVIADFAPLAPVVDVRSTTHLVDSYVFVIEWGKTKIDVVEHALNTARGVYDNLLGVVLNKADLNLLGRYESHRGDYFHNRYFARYGYTD
jgi:polysaccharide biosynthesis transport protein